MKHSLSCGVLSPSRLCYVRRRLQLADIITPSPTATHRLHAGPCGTTGITRTGPAWGPQPPCFQLTKAALQPRLGLQGRLQMYPLWTEPHLHWQPQPLLTRNSCPERVYHREEKPDFLSHRINAPDKIRVKAVYVSKALRLTSMKTLYSSYFQNQAPTELSQADTRLQDRAGPQRTCPPSPALPGQAALKFANHSKRTWATSCLHCLCRMEML